MKLTTTLIVIASIICSTWSYPAGGHPDDDAEYIPGESQPGYPPQSPGYPPQSPGYPPQGPGYPPQGPGYPPQGPGYPPQGPSYPPIFPSIPGFPTFPGIPSYPSIPTIPTVPSIPSAPPSVPSAPPSVPSIPTIPPYPILPHIPLLPPPFPHPGPQVHYYPFGWYSVLNGFDSKQSNDIFGNLRNEAQTAWSTLPSFKPFFRLWPDGSENGTTTTTVKIVGDTKFIIKETTHIQNIGFGSIVYKVRTIEVQPLEPGDVPEAGEVPETGDDGNDERPTVSTDGDIDETTTDDRREPTGDDSDAEFDPNVDIDGNVEVIGSGVDNDISRIYALENMDNSQPIESDESDDKFGLSENAEPLDTIENSNASGSSDEDGDERPTEGPISSEMEHTESPVSTDAPDSIESGNNADFEESAATTNGPLESLEKESTENLGTSKERESLEQIESLEESPESSEHDRESLSVETSLGPNEWYNIEIEVNGSQSSKGTSNENNEGENFEIEIDVPVNLSNDIAINQMLADQGATPDPDAETFDVNLYNVDAEDILKSDEVDNDQEPKSFDYLPYHHKSTGETHSIIK